MTPEEKYKFDRLNNTSYLLRLLLENNGFEIQSFTINHDCIYHVSRNNHTIGTIVSRYDEKLNYTYNNIRLYKYFSNMFPKAGNFMMSQYWIFDDGKAVKFDFNKFETWCNEIISYVDTLGVNTYTDKDTNTVNDAINKLYELVDEYDEKFSTNALIKDIRILLNEHERLNNVIKQYKSDIMDAFLRI